MAITFTNLGASQGTAVAPDVNTSTNAASYATSSWTPPTTGIIILFVINSRDTDLSVEPTVSGNSLTWLKIATVAIDSGVDTYRITLFAADAAGATTGATTVSFGAETQSGCILEFLQAEGVNIGEGIAAAFIQSPTNSGTAATSGSVTLAGASNSNNRPVVCFFHAANEGTGRNPAWDEADDLRHATPAMAGETQSRSDVFDTAATATWTTSSDWLGIAAELRASLTYEESVSIAAVKAVSDAEQIDFGPTIGFSQIAGIDPSVIQNLNTTLGLGKLLAITVDGTVVGLVTKGYVITLDFSTNPVTITSFRATSVEGSDS